MTGLEQTFARLWNDRVGVKVIFAAIGITEWEARRLKRRLKLAPRKRTAPARWSAMAERSAQRARREGLCA